MSLLTLKDVELYAVLVTREKNQESGYAGLLKYISNDANYLLEYIKNKFPEYPGHDIQHSYRILKYISDVLNRKNIEGLSNAEIFCIIMAALFHDTGMALYNEQQYTEEIREKHHEFAKKVIDKYFEEKLDILNNRDRLKNAIVFACESHGKLLSEVYDSELYVKKDKIDGDNLRYSVISSLLRIGDLLDLDSDRVNEFVLSLFSKDFSDISLAHHIRHLRVDTYYFSEKEINIEVKADNIQQYRIWLSWFEYIKNEILYINTYLNRYGISLPLPYTNIKKDPDANFEVEDLRFEIDDTGGIWKILSQSIYTDECDFIRELIQNAIDATLLNIYLDKNIDIQHQSPRSWHIDNMVYIGLSNSRQELFVIDRGVGMNHLELKKFLFKVSGSGYSDLDERSFPFPSIAKYGIGFVSCLINADNIDIFTSKREDNELHYVSLTSNNNLAIMQDLSISDFSGTVIRLKLKHDFSYDKLLNYIKETFIYQSVKIICFDVDKLEKLSNLIFSNQKFKDMINNPYKLVDFLKSVETKRIEIRSPLDAYASIISHVQSAADSLLEWINSNKEQDDKYPDAKKFQDFKISVNEINKFVNSAGNTVPEFPLNSGNISEKELFVNTQDYIDSINKYITSLAPIINENDVKVQLYKHFYETIYNQEVSSDCSWKYCVLYLNENLNISSIKYFDEPVDLSEKTGIILINHKAVDNDEGYEYASSNGFLFRNGFVCNSISKLTGHITRNILHSKEEKNYIIGMPYDDLSFSDLSEKAEEAFWEDDNIDSTYDLDSVFSALICKNNALYSFADVRESDIYNYEHGFTIPNSTIWSVNKVTSIDLIAERYIDSVDMASANESIKFFSDDPDVLCQDGIRLTSKLRGLFPIGIFKICCNLTANSRLPLNVTRHKISEIKSEIEPWIEKKAILIQKSIFNNVKKLLADVSLEIDDVDELITPIYDSDYLSDLLWHRFKYMVSKK